MGTTAIQGVRKAPLRDYCGVSRGVELPAVSDYDINAYLNVSQ